MFLADVDLDTIQLRHRGFWQREIVDRVCIAAIAPAAGPHVNAPVARDDEQLLADPQFAVEKALASVANTYYAGDALPMACAEGNLIYPAFGGAGRFGSATVWVDPALSSWQEWAEYRCDRDNVWARRYLDVNRALAEASEGKYLVGTQGFFGATDAMALIRGPEDFIIELLDEEAHEAIRAAQERALAAHAALIQQSWQDVSAHQEGTLTQPMIWAPGTINYWSADFSCLIGPDSFEKWVVPDFERMAGICDFRMYHLDGPDAVRHLPRIAAIEGIHGIQYVPGAALDGMPDQWLPVVRDIQALGKATYVCIGAGLLDRVLAELDPHGLFVMVHASNPEEADAVVQKAERLTSRRSHV